VTELLVISSDVRELEDSLQPLKKLFSLRFEGLDRLAKLAPAPRMLVDVDLSPRHKDRIVQLREWLLRRPPDAKVIFATERKSHLAEAQAFAIGATGTVSHPIDAKAVVAALWGEFSSLGGDPEDFPAGKKMPAVTKTVDAMQNIFASASLGTAIDAKQLNTASTAVVDQIEAQGLQAWIDIVRMHHSQTYQHCLLVTGVVAAFAQHLGFSSADRNRLSTAGMVHDVGKARIPVAILEKPGPLDKDELATMRKHPEHGLAILASAPSLAPEMLDIVVHHHEYLDGSGYPHGLRASEISDLVRIMTISDVFGALLEKRSYKPPLSAEQAYQILLDMGPKLDKDLVRVFRTVSTSAA